jgi:3-(3-hydroxy-phenyl)propionate hydroxylase
MILKPNIAQPDDFYESLLDAHAGLSDAASSLLNAKLVLLLANQVPDLATLTEAIALARAHVDTDALHLTEQD